MTPAEIAKKLTKAQVRALRDPKRCWDEDWFSFVAAEGQFGALLRLDLNPTPLGCAVLAELDKGETNGSR
jgi:hypothetical protein